jgi:hypothetical protein
MLLGAQARARSGTTLPVAATALVRCNALVSRRGPTSLVRSVLELPRLLGGAARPVQGLAAAVCNCEDKHVVREELVANEVWETVDDYATDRCIKLDGCAWPTGLLVR